MFGWAAVPPDNARRMREGPVGADSIRPQPNGIEPSVEWSKLPVTALGFPRGEAKEG